MLTESQIKNRAQGIGASESSILFNLNEYRTPYQLWLEKTGKLVPDSLEDNINLWWGSKLEDDIADRYEFETGNELLIDPETKYSPECPFMLAHLDRIVKDENKLLEIKTARYNPSKWGMPGTSEVPPQYTIQCQHQLACMPGIDSVDLCVFFWQTKNIAVYPIKRNEELIQKITKAIDNFWQFHVLCNLSPDLFTVEDIRLAYPEDNQIFLEASPIELDAYEKIKEVRKNIKQLEKLENKYKTDLILLTGGNSGIKSNEEIICTYKTTKKGIRTFKLFGEE